MNKEDLYVELRKQIKGETKFKVTVKSKTFSECIFN